MGARLCARALSAVLFAAASTAIVVALAVATTSPSLDTGQWARLGLALTGGGVPLTLLGVALGYWLPPKGVLPAANILYLTLSYLGGLWTGPDGLPGAVRGAARLLPTWQWGEVLWSAVGHGPWPVGNWLALLGYGVVFAALAAWGYRRDEGQRFR
jgi:ABC-2 type transport system permease protein